MDVDEDLHYKQVKKQQAKKRKRRFMEDEEEKGAGAKTKKEKSFLEKCKEVGRIGPEVTKLHLEQNQT
jgi:hypothetical protein